MPHVVIMTVYDMLAPYRQGHNKHTIKEPPTLGALPNDSRTGSVFPEKIRPPRSQRRKEDASDVCAAGLDRPWPATRRPEDPMNRIRYLKGKPHSWSAGYGNGWFQVDDATGPTCCWDFPTSTSASPASGLLPFD